MRVKGSRINIIHFDIVKAMQPINGRRGSRQGKENRQQVEVMILIQNDKPDINRQNKKIRDYIFMQKAYLSYMQIFKWSGVGAPNTLIVQGSTVSVFKNVKHKDNHYDKNANFPKYPKYMCMLN